MQAAQLRKTPARGERLPTSVKLAYAAPGLASAGVALPIYAFMPKFYSDVFLAPLGLIALAIAIARAFDAITDPAMGWISDRFPTRWGRRRPWVAIGVPFTAVAMLAMFGPPASLTPNQAAGWFGLTFGAYFLFHTIYYVPYSALGFELTLDYHDRSALFGWGQAFSLTGTMAAGVAPVFVERLFPDDPTAGYLVVGIAFGGLLVALFGWLVVRIRERPEFVKRESNPIVPGVRRTLRNPPFRLLLTVYAISSVTGAIPATVAPFYIPYVLHPETATLLPMTGGEALTMTIVVYMIAGVLSTPFWVWLSRRRGKRFAWYVSIWVGIIGATAFFFMPAGQNVAFIVAIVFVGTGLGAGLLHSAIKADVIDYDELLTGKRREAQYASFWAMVPKFVVIPSAAVPLAILGASGYVPGADDQPEAVNFALRAILGLGPSLTGVCAFIVALRFPMTEEKHRGVVEGIAAHEAGLPATDPLTGRALPPPHASVVPEETGWFLDHFAPAELARYEKAGTGVLARAWMYAGLYMLVSFGLVVWVFGQVQLLEAKPGIAVTLAVVAAGFALAAAIFQLLRLGAARRLARDEVSREAVSAHLGELRRRWA